MSGAPVVEWGPLVTNSDVDEGVIDTLKYWLPMYLRRSAQRWDERHEGSDILGVLQVPEDNQYAAVLEDDQFPDYTLPAILVTSASTQGDPQKDGDGNYYAAWNVVVSCIVKGRDPKETRVLASLFEGAVRRIMVHADPPHEYGDVEDSGGEVRWTGANVAAVIDPTSSGRYLAAGISTYLVYLDKVVKADAGPAGEPYDPVPDPSDPELPEGELVTVGSVRTDVVGRTPNNDLGE